MRSNFVPPSPLSIEKEECQQTTSTISCHGSGHDGCLDMVTRTPPPKRRSQEYHFDIAHIPQASPTAVPQSKSYRVSSRVYQIASHALRGQIVSRTPRGGGDDAPRVISFRQEDKKKSGSPSKKRTSRRSDGCRPVSCHEPRRRVVTPIDFRLQVAETNSSHCSIFP